MSITPGYSASLFLNSIAANAKASTLFPSSWIFMSSPDENSDELNLSSTESETGPFKSLHLLATSTVFISLDWLGVS